MDAARWWYTWKEKREVVVITLDREGVLPAEGELMMRFSYPHPMRLEGLEVGSTYPRGMRIVRIQHLEEGLRLSGTPCPLRPLEFPGHAWL